MSAHRIFTLESLPESEALETSQTTTSPFSFSSAHAPVDAPASYERPTSTRQEPSSDMDKFLRTLAVCTSSPFDDIEDDTSVTLPALAAANVDKFQFLTMSIQEIRQLLI